MSGPHRRSRTGTRLLFLGALLLGAILMVSCGGGGPGAPTGATLEQATYLTENSREGTATLEDGEFREPVAEGSASELVIRLGKWTTGDIDGRDGVDAAAVTVEDPGGSGTFSYLHALVDDDGELSMRPSRSSESHPGRGRLHPRRRHYRRHVRPGAARAVCGAPDDCRDSSVPA